MSTDRVLVDFEIQFVYYNLMQFRTVRLVNLQSDKFLHHVAALKFHTANLPGPELATNRNVVRC